MKKVINLKEIMIILIAVAIVMASSTVFASGLVIGDNTSTPITGSEYDNAQIPTESNTAVDNTTNNTVNNTTNNTVNNVTNNTKNNNTAKTYNTNNKADLPQTGIEDYNVGILLIICVASAIFAYKKANDYRNI